MASDIQSYIYEELGRYHKDAFWTSNDRILETLFYEKPINKQINELVVKVTAVDRLYKAGLNRQKVDYREVAEAIKSVSNKLDAALDRISQYDSICEDVVSEILTAFNSVAEAIKRRTGKWLDVFVSKYLHFHNPELIPLYDNRVSAPNMRKLLRKLHLEIYDEDFSSQYEWYCKAILKVYEQLEREFSVKDFDIYLYGKGLEE